MIRFQNVSLTLGTRSLFNNTHLTLNPSDKIGLIGDNGTGKSTLFHLLRGTLHADQGSIDFPTSWRVAYVAQETPPLPRNALDYALDGDVTLRRLEHELAQLEVAEHSEENGHRIGMLHSELADADAYTARSRAEQLLVGLGFHPEQMTQPVASFSGGWRMRLNLAQALMCPSDLLLLDEPTNHLDLDAIIWLEDWLKRYTGTLIIISHDRDFLDSVVNVIVHIDGGQLKRYSGHYSSFERQRAAQIALTANILEKQTRQRAHLESFILRFKAKASKARQAQSRVKALEKMEVIAQLPSNLEHSFQFREPKATPNPLLRLEHVQAGYRLESDEVKIILSDITFSLQPGQRIGLLGINGAGKSTLIKTIAGEIPPVEGIMTIGKGLAIGYFAQHQVETLREDESPLWHLGHIAPTTREQELRTFLGSFHFSGDRVTHPIKPLSGGEKARLALALIVWQRPNLLLLDEPTNHLDLATREALTIALAQFDGTLILVSHDRHLLRATTDELMIVSDGTLRSFDGDLDDYRSWLLKTKSDALRASANNVPSPVKNTPPLSTHSESTITKKIEQQLKKLEEKIQADQLQKNDVETKLADPKLYETEHHTTLHNLMARQTELLKNIERLEALWLEQQTEWERLTRRSS